jgi:arylsulfatase
MTNLAKSGHFRTFFLDGQVAPARSASLSIPGEVAIFLGAMRLLALILFALPAFPQADYFPPEITERMKQMPHIILITGDHLRWDHIAANGNPAMITPNIDELVRGGTTFLNHYTVGVACTPNRASLMTGRYPNSHGLISNGIMLPDDEVTLTHVLRDAGYYTGQMGKLHFMPHKDRDHREPYKPYGFHQMRLSDEPGCYDDAYGRWLWSKGPEVRENGRVSMPGERKPMHYYTFAGTDDTTHASFVAAMTNTFLDDAAKRFPERPLFVHSGFYAPHPPLNPPASSLAKHKGRDLPPRYWSDDELNYLPPNFAGRLAGLRGRNQTANWDEYRRHFYAMVTHLDENVGKMMRKVKELGLWDRTIWVLTSDHGDYLGDHAIVNKGDWPYDGAMRIPLVMTGPGIPKGKRVDELVEIVDVMPTLLEMTGLPVPKGNQGLALMPVIEGAAGRDVIYMQGINNRTIRSADAMYSIYMDGEELLFDLQKDPHQLRNVASTATALRDKMRHRLMLKVMQARDPLPTRIRPY